MVITKRITVTINDLILILLFILIAHTAIIKASINESKHSKAEIDLKYFENYYVLDSWRFLLNNDFIIHWIG